MMTGVVVYNIMMIKRKEMLWRNIGSIYTWQYSAYSASMQSALLHPNKYNDDNKEKGNAMEEY